MDLWEFLTVVVVIWGIVTIIKTWRQNRTRKESSVANELEPRIERIEKRIQNLEAIVIDEDMLGQGQHVGGDDESATAKTASSQSAGRAGRLSNSLRDK